MSDLPAPDSMLELFLFETTQLIEQLEQIILAHERSSCFPPAAIQEIFRIMHTIKGSATMMLFDNLAALAHAMEDIFYSLREAKSSRPVDCAALSDLVLEGIDFIKLELAKIKNGGPADGNCAGLSGRIGDFLASLSGEPRDIPVAPRQTAGERQQYYVSQAKTSAASYRNCYKAVVQFAEGCEMEDIRAYTVVRELQNLTDQIYHIPEDLVEEETSLQTIRERGLMIYLKADQSYDELHRLLQQTALLKRLELTRLDDDSEFQRLRGLKRTPAPADRALKTPSLPEAEKTAAESQSGNHQDLITVNISKLDKLLDLIGEQVVAEAMVIESSDLKGLKLNNFRKAARQLQKITTELQDVIIALRMVPLAGTFQKMNRVVRDMSKKLGKEVELTISGAETEVDKKVIEHISDPLMHLVRNAIDHGLESGDKRRALGKPATGRVSLEAKSVGGDVLIIVRDDGKGLNKEQILRKAEENGLLTKPAHLLSEKEIYNLIFLPGFSTKDRVTEFSGRGVGMDVVVQNIAAIGGSVLVDSHPDRGTAITLKIPLTLAIINGMNLRVGNARYTIPTTAIQESFRAKANEIINDPEGNELMLVRGRCLPIIRLHRLYQIETEVTALGSGIIVMVEAEDEAAGIFADELLGEQQIVVKALPNYIKNRHKIGGLSGCTLLGDGSISLILDVPGLIRMNMNRRAAVV